MNDQRAFLDRRYGTGRELLGPVVNLFLLKLHAHLLQTDPSRDRILFALRAGLRIRNLYHAWLQRRGEALPEHGRLFRTSRMMAIKAAYGSAEALAVTVLGQEMQGEPLDRIVGAVLRSVPGARGIERTAELPQRPLHDFLQTDNPVADILRRHLRQQSRMFADYLDAVAGTAERLILVDTGWRGTQQLLFERGFGDREWHGLNFGCSSRASAHGIGPSRLTGLMFDCSDVEEEQPASFLLLHRHLIEGLFEPNLPSSEHIDRQAIRTACDDITESPLADPLHSGVQDYLAGHASDSISAIAEAADSALTILEKMCVQPTRGDVLLLSPKPRSLDLGRTGSLSVVLPARNRFEGDSPDLRIREALWPAGQAAMEYPQPRCRSIQDRLFAAAAQKAGPSGEPSVAIITRTKDRPLLLRRAAESVARQTYRNYLWVVVNDGGDPGPVGEVMALAAIDPARILICSHTTGQGMEAASNAGIRACDSELIVIHDDDDSWEPEFLERSVAVLESSDDIYDGVVSHSMHITEEISGDRVRELSRRPFNAWLENIQLCEMAAANLFPPIAFLYRRQLWEELGGYDESLPVLGDWDFNLRFLTLADIAVLPEPLANYHHRTAEPAGSRYANSDGAARNPHVAYNAILRNRYLRKARLGPPYSVLADLVSGGYRLDDIRARVERVTPQSSASDPSPEEAGAGTSPWMRKRLDAQQQELDRRWVLLEMTVAELIRLRNLKIGTAEMIRHLAGLTDTYAQRTALQAPPDFDEDRYRRDNPDIARAIGEGRYRSGFEHFTRFGRGQGRKRPLAGPNRTQSEHAP